MGRIEGCIGVLRDCLPKLGDGVRESLALSPFHISFLSLPLLLFLSPSFPSLTLSYCLSPLPPLPSLLLTPSLFPLFLFPTIPISLCSTCSTPTSTYVCVHYKPVQQHGDPNQLAYETQVLVPQPFMGTIIGTAGSKIKELRSVSHSAWRSGLLHWDPILALCLVTCSKFSPCVMSHS
jgi:hypothetical protein